MKKIETDILFGGGAELLHRLTALYVREKSEKQELPTSGLLPKFSF